MAHMWLVHDAHLGRAFLFLEIFWLIIYIAVNQSHGSSMSKVCSWNAVGDVLCQVSSLIGADFGAQGMRTAIFQFSESGSSVNGPNLFIELPFLYKSLPNPSFTEFPLPTSLKNPFFHSKVLRRIPFPKIGSYSISFCTRPLMLLENDCDFPGQTLAISEALRPQGMPH